MDKVQKTYFIYSTTIVRTLQNLLEFVDRQIGLGHSLCSILSLLFTLPPARRSLQEPSRHPTAEWLSYYSTLRRPISESVICEMSIV
jgi:hypothetical protein